MKRSGIPHLASLEATKFLWFIENLSKLTITEKLDGSNLVFGFTKYGVFYTSRESKNGGKMFFDHSYDLVASNNGFRSAHIALSNIQDSLRDIVGCGNAIEVEVLYGVQPNIITYGQNHIVFLRAVQGDNGQLPDQGVIDRLSEASRNINTIKADTIKVIAVKEAELDLISCSDHWSFSAVAQVQSLVFNEIYHYWDVLQFDDWLNSIHPELHISHGDVLNINLNRVPTRDRPTVRKFREKDRETEQQFKTTIVNTIIDSVLRVTPSVLATVTPGPNDVKGIEGIVILDPETLEQTKVVDVGVFTEANQFLHAVRNQIKNTFNKSHPFGAIIVRDGDLYGNMLMDFADILGVRDLGAYLKIKQCFKPYVGVTIAETVKNFTDTIDNGDETTKRKFEYAVAKHILVLDDAFKRYKENWKYFSHTLQSGQTIRFNQHVHERNIIAFLEMREELRRLQEQIRDSGGLVEIIQAIYHKQLVELHDA